MAKNKIEIDVNVDDNGTTRKLGLDAKKTSENLDKTGRSAHTADRNIKGAAQASSNASKNFSKMSQGMGGLVGAYATFAAQMFALTAAFGFFKRAAELSVLQQGQLAYASATGIAMRTLTKDIQEATDAQITFRDAAQAAAIGTAAGLSADQLKRLGTAAKDASAVLGRDVTDSFNRLVRGVTKAEPELLDELGIILRLEKASENYARALGINAKDLTQFQKSQAVANEVLGQAENKYSRILAVTGGGATNQFAQLGKSFDDIVMTIQNALLPVANALAKVLSETPALAGAGFAVLASGPLKALGFSLKDAAEEQTRLADAAKASYTAQKAQVLDLTGAIATQKRTIQNTSQAILRMPEYKGGSKLLQNVGATGVITPQARASIKRGLSALNLDVAGSTVIQKGMFKGLTVEVVRMYADMVNKLDGLEKQKAAGTVSAVERMKLAWQGLTTTVRSAAAAIVSFGAKAIRALGTILMVVTAIKTAFELFRDDSAIDGATQALEDHRQKIEDLTKDYKTFIAVQDILSEEGTGGQGISRFGATGGVLGALNLEESISLFKDFNSFTEKNGQEYLRVRDAIQKKDRSLSERFLTYIGQSYYPSLKEAAPGRVEAGIIRDIFGSYFDSPEALTDAEINAGKFADLQLKAISSLEKKFGKAKAFSAYKALLGDPDATQEQIKTALENVNKITNLFKNYQKTVTDAEDATKDFYTSLAPQNAAEKAIAKQKEIIKAAKQVQNQLKPGIMDKALGAFGIYTPNPVVEQARTDEANAKKEIQRLEKINTALHKRKMLTQDAALVTKQAQAIEIPALKTVATLGAKVNSDKTKRNNLESELSTLIDEVAQGEKNLTSAQQRKKEELEKAIQLAKEDLNQSERKLQLANQIVDIELEIYSLKTDQKPLQIAKQLLDFDKQALAVIQRRRALEARSRDVLINKQMREKEGFGGALKNREYERTKLELEAAKLNKAKDENDIRDEFALKKQMQEADNALQMVKMQLLQQEMNKLAIERENIAEQFRLEAMKKAPGSQERADLLGRADRINRLVGPTGEYVDDTMQEIQTRISNILSKLPGQGQALLNIIDEEEAAALADVGINIDILSDKLKKLRPVEQMVKDIGDALETNLATAFRDIITGAQSAKDAFKGMANAMLNAIAQIVAEAMALQVLKSMGLGSLIGSRDGSVISDGRKLPGYATGGIARGKDSGYPVMLHGTEAVVPLPNGKSIPVEMTGEGGSKQENNITINIASDGTQQEGGTGEADSKTLAKAVAKVVQAELQNQKRNGGILSPYGVA